MILPITATSVLAADLLTPENLGGAGVGLGTVALWTFISAVRKIGALVDKATVAASKAGEGIEALSRHLKEEERHHKSIEGTSQQQLEALQRLERATAGIPRPVTGDHTPVQSVPVGGQ